MAGLARPVGSSVAAPGLPQIQQAHDIPQFCLKVAIALYEAPPFQGRYLQSKDCRIIPLESYEVSRICDIFNKNARHQNRIGWEIHEVGENNAKDVNNRPIPQGVSLWMDNNPKRCSTEALEHIYNEILVQLATGWKRAKPEDHEKSLMKQDPKEYDLFIKSPTLIDQETLIRFIARQLNLAEEISCNNSWLDVRPADTYIWVKKASLKTFIAKTGFNLPEW